MQPLQRHQQFGRTRYVEQYADEGFQVARDNTSRINQSIWPNRAERLGLGLGKALYPVSQLIAMFNVLME